MRQGIKALMWASRAGHCDVIHSLIQAGASIDRKCRLVRTLHNLCYERHDREESRYKQED